ncbi:MAG: beta-glucosidase [Lachnospiraceae bacterium]|nr:beta-glucosidase [Lachnospiraceae bacterium]
MDKMILDFDNYSKTARQAAAEGQVLLRNDDHVLPLKEHTQVAVFGRIQSHYYKSGTGSGGLVNVVKVTGILEALQESDKVTVNEKLLNVYKQWEEDHPFDEGIGWGNEPWSQEEMPISDELAAEIAAETDTAILIIGRTAGEDQDNLNKPGSYLLAEKEEQMLETVRRHFAKMVVVLNVGNIIDMEFEDKFRPDAVLYAWQGGMVGGQGTVDVLTGVVNPSGKLPDTIAYSLKDYPSDANFGNQDKDIYEEDIYVGYRYFETAAKEKVRYPFGYGLSYTEFTSTVTSFSVLEDKAVLKVLVKNAGKSAGKEVVQVYAAPPQGKLGKPSRNLVGFAKTDELKPGDMQELTIELSFYAMASYDETGLTGYVSSYVMEEGTYRIYAGNNVRDAKEAGSFIIEETRQIEALSQVLAPVEIFNRLKPAMKEDGSCFFVKEEVPLRKVNPSEKRKANLPEEISYTGNKGYKLIDVKHSRVSMKDFIAQLSDEDLSCIIRGEGMSSPKVTSGTASAFGGISESLKSYGIPCGCCTDGPSGIRLDSGMKAFSLPNGTLLASTFNTELVEKLYGYTSVEMVYHKVDALLGPGMNIHRHPLNGRNFEYFSEDPFVTGKMAAAMVRGLQKAGVTGTAKHFCANNRETRRRHINSVISERALREIYLKGFEIAVREGNADSIMTTYGGVNGIWTAGSYDLNTVILRGEWGFTGIVMTDWWAQINDEGKEALANNLAAMARSQNDLYMVCVDAAVNGTDDNTLSSLKDGSLLRGELQRNAMNICSFLLHTHALERMEGIEAQVEIVGEEASAAGQYEEAAHYKVENEITINLEDVDTGKGANYVFALDLDKAGGYRVEVTAKSELGELAQIPVTLFYRNIPMAVFSFNGTNGKLDSRVRKVLLRNRCIVLRLSFGQSGLDAKEIRFTFDKELKEIQDSDKYAEV